MKVLFCAYDRPGHIATGPNAWIQRLIPDLRNTYHIDVQTLFIYNGVVKDCPTLSFFESNALPVFTIDRENTNYVVDQVREILKIIKEHNFDILVANLVIPALYASRFLKPHNVPIIGVMHSNDMFYHGVIDKFIKGKKEDQLTASVSVSNYIQNLASSIETKILSVVIPCGTPMPDKKAQRIDQKEPLKIMYAGRLEVTQKQIIKLTNSFLNASKHNPYLEFSIYGSGSQEDEVKLLLGAANFDHKVTYHGSVLPSKIQEVMSNHHIFTLMSDYEGMPIALMEAMACGLVPVCLEEESGIDEIIEDGVNGFIVKDRGADYQKNLQLLLQNTELWEKMSKNAISTIAQRYSTGITHKRWSDLLQTFATHKVKPISIPRSIRLEGALLFYGDNRKPTQGEILQKSCKDQWMRLRLLVRPRTRINALLKYIKA